MISTLPLLLLLIGSLIHHDTTTTASASTSTLADTQQIHRHSQRSLEEEEEGEYEGEESTLRPTVPKSNVPVLKKYSYMCLEKNPVLCLGLSPGMEDEDEPYPGLFLQLKHKLRNEYRATDYKKMRWDAINEDGRIHLSNFTNLCLAKKLDSSTVNLFDCSKPVVEKSKWFVDTQPHSGGLSVIRLNGTDWCLSVRDCFRDAQGKCLPTTDAGVATGGPHSYVDGARVTANGCYDTLNIPEFKDAQLFRVELDCNAGCSPDLLHNNFCDDHCNTEACLWDNEDCRFSGPPTEPHTHSPTTRNPTLKPTGKPSTGKPTSTSNPTNKPTVPVESPTEPVVIGTVTQSPTGPPLPLDGWSLFFLILFIVLFFCCMCFCVMFRKRRDARKQEEEDQMVDIDAMDQPNGSSRNLGSETVSKPKYLGGLFPSSGRRNIEPEDDGFDEIDLHSARGKTSNQELTHV